MGQKINPKAFRLGVKFSWSSQWFANDERYRKFLLQDVKLREILMKNLANAGISQVTIKRSINKIDITLHVSRPGVAIGKGGKNLEEIKKLVDNFFKNEIENFKIDLQVEPVGQPNLDAYLVAKNITEQLERRIPHRRVVYKTMELVMSAGAKGVQVVLSGRIAGAEIGRTEKYKKGTVPLSTIKADLDFAKVPALTKSGYVGVKVWICRP
jgi:small subunit ribosomal protein S3